MQQVEKTKDELIKALELKVDILLNKIQSYQCQVESLTEEIKQLEIKHEA